MKPGPHKKEKEKEKAAKKVTIAIPGQDDEDVDLSDQDLDVLEAFGNGASFLKQLDRKGISRWAPVQLSTADLSMLYYIGARRKPPGSINSISL